MTAPRDPNSPATSASATAAGTDSDDEVVDGELVDDGSGTLAAADAPADDSADMSEAEISSDNAADTLAPADALADRSADKPDVTSGASTDAPGPESVAISAATQGDPPAFDYTDAGVPTLGYLQDKIEKRLGTAQGSTELNESSNSGRQSADREAERERLAQAKLDEIRKSVEGR